jgi:hypothetical protein
MTIKKVIARLTAQFGANAVITGSDVQNASSEQFLNKNVLFLNDHHFVNHFKNKNNISIQMFIEDYCLKRNTAKGNNYYHKWMDYVFDYYDIDVNDGVSIDLSNAPQVRWKREEFYVLWYINFKIRNHPFLQQFANTKLNPGYQKKLDDVTSCIYDCVYPEINFVIEVQEDSRAHMLNSNDELKKALAYFTQNAIKYIHVKNSHEKPLGYMEDIWKELERYFVGAILQDDDKSQGEYIREVLFLEHLKVIENQLRVRIRKLENSGDVDQDELFGLTEEMMSLKSYIEKPDSGMIAKLFDLKDRMEKNPVEEYIVDVQMAIDLLRVDHAKRTQFESEFKRIGINKKIGKKYFLDWRGLLQLIYSTDYAGACHKKLLIDYLALVDKFYRQIITNMRVYNSMRHSVTKQMIENVVDKYDTKTKQDFDTLQTNYKKQLDKRNYKLERLETDIMEIYDLMNKLNSKVIDYKTWKSEMRNTWSYRRLFKEDVDTYTIQKKENQSIIEEMPDFPIWYVFERYKYGENYEKENHVLPIEIFDAVLSDYNIPKDAVEIIKNKFIPWHISHSKIKEIPYLKIMDDDKILKKYYGKLEYINHVVDYFDYDTFVPRSMQNTSDTESQDSEDISDFEN